MATSQRYVPTLHHLSHSSAFRCLWALEELQEAHGIVYNLKNYKRQRGQAPPELQSVFSLGKSPILTLEPTTEDQPLPTLQIKPGVLIEAQLIIRFLSEEYGKGLWDSGMEADKNRDVFFQAFTLNTLQPKIDILVVIETFASFLPPGFSHLVRLLLSPVLLFWKNNLLRPLFQILEDALDKKPWFAGGKLGQADFHACWCMDWATQRDFIPLDEFPRLRDWHGRTKSRGAYRRALEKGNGYDLKTLGLNE
ncbi:hypothetical protein F5Y15DRAFT_419586 [Xylariaceae sp. FL0016]|nr:hypothetical protein F5Y15DRAFT_419586 [Xylariaceae sp. FL0016]